MMVMHITAQLSRSAAAAGTLCQPRTKNGRWPKTNATGEGRTRRTAAIKTAIGANSTTECLDTARNPAQNPAARMRLGVARRSRRDQEYMAATNPSVAAASDVASPPWASISGAKAASVSATKAAFRPKSSRAHRKINRQVSAERIAIIARPAARIAAGSLPSL